MSVKKDFLKYVIPSIIGMLVVSLDILVDGIFVGRGLGPQALAAVNLVSPIMSILSAIAVFLSVGGATLASVKLGQGDHKEANNIFNQSFYMVVLFTAAVTLLSVFFTGKLVRILGATDVLFNDAYTYLKYYAMFSIFTNLTITLSNFVRSDNGPMIAMACHGVGSILNIVFDYIFIYKFHWGVMGAAVATQLGDFFGLLLLLTHFMFKRGNLRFAVVKLKQIGEIVRTGTPELMSQLADPISVFIFNIAAIKLLGEFGLSAYSIISYIVTVIITIFLGISQGMQPLIGYNYGRGSMDRVKQTFKMGLKMSLVVSVIIYISIILFGDIIISVFTTDKALIQLTNNALRVYGLSLIIAPINLIYISYYTSVNKIKIANIISVLRGVLFILVFVIMTPKFMGVFGLWFSMLLVEASTLTFIQIYKKYSATQNLEVNEKEIIKMSNI